MITKTSGLWDLSRAEIILGKYQIGQAVHLGDPTFLQSAQDYRRMAAARMVAIEPTAIAQKIPEGSYHVSRKMDGEFTVLCYRDGELFTINPGGTVRLGLPWQEQAKSILEKANIREAMLAGELYGHAPEGGRERIHDLLSVIRQPRNESELDQIAFAVFDVLSLNGSSPSSLFADRWTWIEKTFPQGNKIHAVEATWVDNPKAIDRWVDQWIYQQGAEGVVARSDSGGTFKIKQRHNLDLVVVGFSESIGDRQGMLHDMLVAVKRNDGTLQIVSRVGGGFTDEARRLYLSDLKDMVVESQYAEVNSDHVAYQMVAPEWVIEVSCLDVLSQTTRGGPIQRMVIDFESGTKPHYRVVRPLPLATLISPQFIRIRDDKQPTQESVRIQQITERVEVPLSDARAGELEQPASHVIRREVFVKESKGSMMIRKFVLWETNKGESDDYLAYGLHFTDFSANRKTPLEREVKVSNSREQIETLFEQMKADNIKSGWKAYSPSSS